MVQLLPRGQVQADRKSSLAKPGIWNASDCFTCSLVEKGGSAVWIELIILIQKMNMDYDSYVYCLRYVATCGKQHLATLQSENLWNHHFRLGFNANVTGTASWSLHLWSRFSVHAKFLATHCKGQNFASRNYDLRACLAPYAAPGSSKVQVLWSDATGAHQ